MIRTIRLHGRLGRELGREHRFAVASPAEAVQALIHVLPSAGQALLRGAYRVFRGPRREGRDHFAGELHIQLSDRDREIHIVPVGRGAKRGGVGKVILGAALLASSFAFPGLNVLGAGIITAQSVGAMGLGLMLSGVGNVLAPEAQRQEAAERERSNAFNGPANVNQPGAPVPVIFGETLVGSVVVSAAVDIKRRAATS